MGFNHYVWKLENRNLTLNKYKRENTDSKRVLVLNPEENRKFMQDYLNFVNKEERFCSCRGWIGTLIDTLSKVE